MASRKLKLPNGSLPPTFSVGTAKEFFDGIANYPPVNAVDENYLEQIGISEGTIKSLLGGLRWAKIIDEDNGDQLTDPNLPHRLRNPHTRRQAFQEILETTYPDLLMQPNLEKATIDTIVSYFERHNVKSTSSGRAARLFMWLAQEAGLKLGETIPTPLPRPVRSLRDSRNPIEHLPDSRRNDNLAESIEHASSADAKRRKEQLVDILLANLQASKQIPDKEVIEKIQQMIDDIEGDDNEIDK